MADPAGRPADRYRAAWAAGGPPELAAFLAAAGTLSVASTADVLRVDQHERARAGTPAPAEFYLDTFPAVVDDAESVMTLVYGEVLDRTDRGEAPTLAEYTARFPQYAEFLSLQWEVHDALGGVAVSDTLTPAGPRRGPADDDGPVIPGYAIEEMVGAGSAGVVYRARQDRLGRVVALKVVRDGQFARPADLVRFLEEARVIARLGHPNIVGIHELGKHPGGPYMALEWVGGGTLADRLKARPYDPPGAVGLLAVVARAVGHAHQAEVVHRDLKPANILLTEAGDPKVADFGLAKHLELGNIGATVTGQSLGTPQYMSPEQARGGRDITRAADVYSLGAILYEMLTGQPPLAGATVQDTLRLVAERDPIPPRQLNAKLPKDLATVVMKCLDKDPARRYPSAHELADDLDRHKLGLPVLARPVGPAFRVARWAGRNRKAAAVAAVVAGLVAVIAVGGVVAAVKISADREAHLVIAFKWHAADAGRDDEAWRRSLADAKAARGGGRSGRRVTALKHIDDARDTLAARHAGRPIPADELAALRDEAAATFALADAVTIGPKAPTVEGETAVAIDPADGRVVYRTAAGGLVFRDRATGNAATAPVPGSPAAGGAVRHPHGGYVATTIGPLVHFTSPTGAAAREPIPVFAAAPGRLVFFPDEADAGFAVSADAAGVLRIWDLDAGRAVFTAAFDIDAEVPPAFAPAGRTLWYSARGRAELLAIHLPDGYEEVGRGRATAGFASPPPCAVCPGGRFVAFPTAAGVRVFDRTTRREYAGTAVAGWADVRFDPPGGGLEVLAGGAAAPADDCPWRACLHSRRGEPLVRLEAADGSRLASGRVSGKRTVFVAVGIDSRGVHVWDIAKLRDHLARHSLNWTDSDP